MAKRFSVEEDNSKRFRFENPYRTRVFSLIANDVSEDDNVIHNEYQVQLAEYLNNFADHFVFKVDPKKLTGRMVKGLSKALTDIDSIDENFWSSQSWNDVVRLFEPAALLAESSGRLSEHSVNPSDVVKAERAFSCPFQRPDTSLSLLKHAGSCLENWNSAHFFSPYAAIHNASMMGKSRCVSELYRWGIFTINLSFQKPGSGNVPQRTPFIADWMTYGTQNGAESCEDVFGGFLIESIIALTEWLDKQSREVCLIELARIWNQEQKVYLGRNIIERANGYSLGSGTDRFGSEKLKIQMKIVHDKLKDVMKRLNQNNAGKLLTEAGIKTPVSVIFIFDEARQLLLPEHRVQGLERFRILRRALQILPQAPTGSFFAYVMDTTSQISNLAPSKAVEPSQRAREKGQQLFQPFWWLPTIDVWPQCSAIHTLSELSMARFYSVFGRPGLHSCFAGIDMKLDNLEEHLTNTESYLIDILEVKLICADPTKNTGFSIDQALAVVSARTSLNVSAACKVAATLTASHMRMCVGISDDRESVFTFQAPEPALALASMRLTYRAGWKGILRHLRDSAASMFTDAGYRGELGAQILLLMALGRLAPAALGHDGNWTDKRRMMFSETRIPLIPLYDLLKILVGEEVCVESGLDKKTKNMYVRVVQFVQMFCKPTLAHVIALFQRGAAFVCKRGAQYADIIFPVIIVKPDENLSEIRPGKENLTVFLIQVKCLIKMLSSSRTVTVCSTLLQRNGCTKGMNGSLNYVSLFLELGNRQDSACLKPSDTLNVSSPSLRERKAALKNTWKASHKRAGEVFESTGKHPDPRQTSIVVEYLRPSNVLDPEDSEQQKLDTDFSALMKAHYDPVKLKNTSEEAVRNLKMSLGCLYKDYQAQ